MTHFQEPTEQVAGNMDIQTMMAIRHNFQNNGYLVKAKEFPTQYWTINAYPQPAQTQPTKVINAQPEWRLSS